MMKATQNKLLMTQAEAFVVCICSSHAEVGSILVWFGGDASGHTGYETSLIPKSGGGRDDPLLSNRLTTVRTPPLLGFAELA